MVPELKYVIFYVVVHAEFMHNLLILVWFRLSLTGISVTC